MLNRFPATLALRRASLTANRHVPRITKRTLLANPSLDADIYSKLKNELEFTKFKPDTYPNPLFKFNTDELLELGEEDLTHLSKLPYKSLSETDNFCFNVIRIVHENIIKNPPVAKRFLACLTDPKLRQVVVSCLKEYYKSNRLRESILQFIIDPDNPETRRSIFANIESIIFHPSTPEEEKLVLLINYMRKLAQCSSPNETAFLLHDKTANAIMNLTTDDQKTELYSYFLHINMKFFDMTLFEKYKTSLLYGSNLRRLVAKTGIIDPKWHHTNKHHYSEEHKQKMVHFFTFNDLRLFTSQAIESKDLLAANMYLDLLVKKLEILPKSLSTADHKKRVLNMLQTLLQYSMVFQGPEQCIKFLHYMPKAGLDLRPATMLRVLSQLRREMCYDEALFLINNLHSCELLPNQREVLVNEIIGVISSKFAAHPKIVLAYYASMFNRKQDEALHLLDKLGVLQLIHGKDFLNKKFTEIPRADIHQDLKGCSLRHSHIHNMYYVALKKMKSEMRTPELIKCLYDKYMTEVRCSDQSSPLHESNIDESIVCLLVEYLLKISPGSVDMDLGKDKRKFETAKEISQDFFDKIGLVREKKKVYLLEMLISSALLQHNDYTFAASMLKFSKDMKMATTFNQIYPFIMYHYVRGETSKAEAWYNLMVKEGVKNKSVASDRLITIAKECGWATIGTSYKRAVTKRNKRERRELAQLNKNRLQSLARNNLADQSSHPSNLLRELSAIIGANPVSTTDTEDSSL